MNILIPVLLILSILMVGSTLIDFHYTVMGGYVIFGVFEAINLAGMVLIAGICLGILVLHYLQRWREVGAKSAKSAKSAESAKSEEVY